tara:strand:+ start:1129 stop:1473 length:345 start_codon:yes stop_codon:yes gene_type:complete
LITSSNINFDRVIKGGALISADHYRLYYLYKSSSGCRLGISIPKSVISKASERNRLKRVVRNAVEPLKETRVDVVFLLKKNLDQYSRNDDTIVREQLLRDTKIILINKKNNGIS